MKECTPPGVGLLIKIPVCVFIAMVGAVVFAGCHPCKSNLGYGRYTIRIDCDTVKTAEGNFTVTRQGKDLMLGGHTLSRGVYRKTRPWLYVHRIGQLKSKVKCEAFDLDEQTATVVFTATLY